MHKKKDEQDVPVVQDLAHVFSLPLRVMPEPWEDLASLLSRTAVEMGYTKVQWLLRPEDVGYRRLPEAVCLLSKEADYRFLERLLQLEEEELYRLTYHRFCGRIQPPERVRASLPGEIRRPLLEQSSLRLFLSQQGTRVCPQCLAEDPAHSVLYWNAGPVVACLKHRVFLVDRCPVCHGSIPLLRSALPCCPRCKRGHYCQAPTVAIPNDPLFQTSQAQVLMNLGVGVGDKGMVLTGCDESLLQKLLPWQYFRLLDVFQRMLTLLLPEHPFLRKIPAFHMALSRHDRYKSRLSLQEWSVVIATFHSIFASWPDNFFAFLDAFSSVRGKVGPGVRKEFYGLYKELYSTNLRNPDFSFLHEAFAKYIAREYTGNRTTRGLLVFQGEHSKSFHERSYLTQGQVRKMLHIGDEMLQTLMDHGILRASQKQIGPRGANRFLFIERSGVEALLPESDDHYLLNPPLARGWGGLLPLNAVAVSWLGISDPLVFALTEAGFLTPLRGPKVDEYTRWLYRETEVKQFVTSWLLLAERGLHEATDTVPLAKTVFLFKLSFIEVLTAIREGRLHLIDSSIEGPLFQRLVLKRAELKNYADQKKGERRKELGVLTVNECAASLGVGPSTVLRWMRLGLLEEEKVRIAGKRYILSQAALDAFRQKYIVSEEAAALLRVHHRIVLLCITAGRLHPVDGYWPKRIYLFRREEVESLQLPTGLAVPEAVKLLGIFPLTRHRKIYT